MRVETSRKFRNGRVVRESKKYINLFYISFMRAAVRGSRKSEGSNVNSKVRRLYREGAVSKVKSKKEMYVSRTIVSEREMRRLK